jgi:hypothetical protein
VRGVGIRRIDSSRGRGSRRVGLLMAAGQAEQQQAERQQEERQERPGEEEDEEEERRRQRVKLGRPKTSVPTSL